MAQALRSPRLRGRPEAAGQHITRSDLLPHPRHFRGRHHAATIFVVLLLAVFGFRLFPEQDVTVLSNGRSYRVSATFDPQHEALVAARVDLSPGDRVLGGTGGSHLSLAVERARPVVIDVDGSTLEVRTQAATIAGALASAGVELRPGDRVYLDGQLATDRGPLFGGSFASRQAPALSLSGGIPADALEIRVLRAKAVSVEVDTMRVDLRSAATTVNGLLEELGMTVRDGDLVRPALDTPLTAGMTVSLAKGRSVNVKLDGKEQVLYTRAQTVGDILALLGVNPGPDELLDPPRETVVTNGMSVVIGLTRVAEEDVREPIAPPTTYEQDPSLPAGTTKLIEGTPGVYLSHYQITYKNGQEVSRVKTGGEVAQPPVPSRQITGTKAAASASKPTLDAPGYTGSYKRVMTVQTTWYNASGGAWARSDPNYGRTATGVIVDKGICAVDPSVIPLGTRFWVPGYGMCIAADTGGAIKGSMVDLGFPESAGNPGWGAPVVDIYILD